MTEATAQEITITRTYDAPREAVWSAWTEPEQLVQWWGPPGWSTPLETVTMEVRPGGTFRLTSVSGDGTEMPVVGVYREVVEGERLVLDEPAEQAWHEGSVSVVTFTDLGGGRTEVAIQATIHTTDEMRQNAERGMNATLDRLGEHLGS
ncbi:MAG TPA: SRPBCC domain-containing protein [Thermoleophilaceae bacterium]|nr:SRPBCC domain-containing protein [Thermoleophilaceae bacterium]